MTVARREGLMRAQVLIVSAAFLAACGPTATDEASAQTAVADAGAPAASSDPAPSTSDAEAPDLAALLGAIRMMPSPEGLVDNLCGEAVAPQILPVEVGGSVGTAQLVIVPGGPNTAACYGDVPGDMFLLAQDGEGWRTIFTGGGYINVLPETHGGVHDFALGGPGTQHPVFEWSGTDYVISRRTIDDALFAATPSAP